MATQFGDASNNFLIGSAGNDTIAGLDGDDTIDGVQGNNLLLGNQGNDLITAGPGPNTVSGGMDDDSISAGDGNNLLFGNEGNDVITAGNGNNTVVGGQDASDGADLIRSGAGNDLILGNGGNDTIASGMGNDTAVGGYGDDVILGQQGDDVILGNQGDDTLVGGMGNDTLYGGMGNDLVYGNEGNDVIIGGEGDDTASFRGARASYTITQNTDGSFVLSGADGSDTVSTVEHFRFDDGTVDAANLIQQPIGGGPAPTPAPAPAPAPTPDTYVGKETNGQITFNPSILANDMPQGDRLEVARVLNVTATSSDGMALEITPDPVGPGQVAKYQFKTGSGTDTLTISSDGFVSATFDGPQTGNQVTFNFDYADMNANGTSATTAHVKATVTGLEAPPVVATSRGVLTYAKGEGAAQIDNGISVTDADGADLTSANVQITDNYSKGEDVLDLGPSLSRSSTPESAGVFKGYYHIITTGYEDLYEKFDSDTGAFMVVGLDTHGHYEDVLDSVTYKDTNNIDPSTVTRTVTFTGTDEDGVSSAGATDKIVFLPTAEPDNPTFPAAARFATESAAMSGNSYVFTPHAGHQTIVDFVAGGPAHDTLSFLGSDFHNDVANVLNHTHNVQGGVVINDPTTQDKVFLSGVHKGQLVANPNDVTFHA